MLADAGSARVQLTDKLVETMSQSLRNVKMGTSTEAELILCPQA